MVARFLILWVFHCNISDVASDVALAFDWPLPAVYYPCCGCDRFAGESGRRQEKFILDHGYLVAGYSDEQLIDRLYSEMVEYSVLTPYLGSAMLDEININSWDDITLSWSDGHMEKLKEHFHSPGHAVDIVKRLLHHSGMIIDNAAPIAQGHLPDNTRITALKSPVVDEDCGISVSIRLLHPQRVDRKCLIDSGMATEEMMEFLEMCIRYGVSLVVAGRTSSGKTTLLNALLAS